jgi:hypothetical protein
MIFRYPRIDGACYLRISTSAKNCAMSIVPDGSCKGGLKHALVVLQKRIGTSLPQQNIYLSASAGGKCGSPKGGIAVGILRVWVRPLIEHKPAQLFVLLLRRQVEFRPPIVIRGVQINAREHELPGQFHLSVNHGIVQLRTSILINPGSRFSFWQLSNHAIISQCRFLRLQSGFVLA